MPVSPIIQAFDLSRTLALGGRELHVLKGLTFTVARGEWVALPGPSGSGKSTLLAGIDTLTAGGCGSAAASTSRITGERPLAQIRNARVCTCPSPST